MPGIRAINSEKVVHFAKNVTRERVLEPTMPEMDRVNGVRNFARHSAFSRLMKNDVAATAVVGHSNNSNFFHQFI